MLAPFPDAVTWKCSVKRLFLKFSQFSQLWQLLASECRESSIAKISSLDKQSSWIHLWYYHSSTVKLLFCQHGFTFPTFTTFFYCLAYPTPLLLYSCSVSLISSSSLKTGSWGESLSGSDWKPCTVTELLSILSEYDYLAEYFIHLLKILYKML